MREIKFRAWKNNTMIQPCYCEIFKDGSHTGGDIWVNSSNCVLMQFTGLLDKNGKEIYEGDIVRFAVDFPEQPFDDGIVRWADGGFWTSQTIDDLEELLSDELNDLEGEVIGNIYENPAGCGIT